MRDRGCLRAERTCGATGQGRSWRTTEECVDAMPGADGRGIWDCIGRVGSPWKGDWGWKIEWARAWCRAWLSTVSACAVAASDMHAPHGTKERGS